MCGADGRAGGAGGTLPARASPGRGVRLSTPLPAASLPPAPGSSAPTCQPCQRLACTRVDVDPDPTPCVCLQYLPESVRDALNRDVVTLFGYDVAQRLVGNFYSLASASTGDIENAACVVGGTAARRSSGLLPPCSGRARAGGQAGVAGS